jgi:hypothetical protein
VATHIEERAATTRAQGQGTEAVRPYPGYRALWVWLLLGWWRAALTARSPAPSSPT